MPAPKDPKLVAARRIIWRRLHRFVSEILGTFRKSPNELLKEVEDKAVPLQPEPDRKA